MNMATRLTKRAVDAAEPRDKPYVLWDRDIPGFGLKVHPSGRKTYVLKYRFGGGRGGRRREPVIGVHGTLTPDEARRIAIDWGRDIASGIDPAAAREAQRSAPSVSELLDRYLQDHAEPHKKPSSVQNDRRIIEKTLKPAFRRIKVRDLARDDVAKLHARMATTPYEANRTLALLSKVLNLAELWDLREDGSNPCRHVRRYKEERRERLLSEHELARLGSVLMQAQNGPLRMSVGRETLIYPPAISAIRLLLFTGARVGEILSLEWDWINWTMCRAELPDSKTGRKFVYLPAPAMEVLNDIRNGSPDARFVIAGRHPGTHLVNLKDPWGIIREVAGMPDLRIHDLRHCFASVGASRGMSLPLIGALLGHKDVATTQRYAHLSDDPVRRASDEIASQVNAALSLASDT